jgi:hypothetical protein
MDKAAMEMMATIAIATSAMVNPRSFERGSVFRGRRIIGDSIGNP